MTQYDNKKSVAMLQGRRSATTIVTITVNVSMAAVDVILATLVNTAKVGTSQKVDVTKINAVSSLRAEHTLLK